MVKDKQTKAVRPTPSGTLEAEVNLLFTQAVSYRDSVGVTPSLQLGYVRELIGSGEDYTEFVNLNKNGKDCDVPEPCNCGEGQECNQCSPHLENVCSVEDAVGLCNNMSPFDGVANLLATVKKYEYIALMEDAYAETGDKPFKLKPTIQAAPTQAQKDEAANAMFEQVDSFLSENNVRLNELPFVFGEGDLTEIVKSLSSSVKQQADSDLHDSTEQVEAALKLTFTRANFMREYMEVIKDTTNKPIGILWVDDKTIKKETSVKSGKLAINYSMQCDAKRIDPCYFWATQDYELNRVGQAVFKLEQYTSGDIHRWLEYTKSNQIKQNIKDYLHDYKKTGYRMYEAMLFRDHFTQQDLNFDVLVSRGYYSREAVEELKLEIPEIYDKENMLPCEVFISGGMILKARVFPCIDDELGVYTTLFRRKSQSIFGYSLHDFIYPFTKLYEGSIQAIDKAMGKSVGSIVQVDTGVIEDPTKYIKKNEATGEVTLDLSNDLIIEFDSTQAIMSPNFKGVPIHVTQLPSDLEKLLPVVDFVFQQLEKISGIESILVSSSSISSALRTDSNFNAAFKSSAKSVKSLFRESENRILIKAVKFIFMAKAMSDDLSDYLIDAEPEILLSDTLSREAGDDQKLLQGVTTMMQLGGDLISQDQMAALLNRVGREVFNFTEDLIPGVEPLEVSTVSTPSASEITA